MSEFPRSGRYAGFRKGMRVQHRRTGETGELVRREGERGAVVAWDSGQRGIGWLEDLERPDVAAPLTVEELVRQTWPVIRAAEVVVPDRIGGMHPSLVALYDVAQGWRNLVSDLGSGSPGGVND